jgi:chromosome segregation ATPase
VPDWLHVAVHGTAGTHGDRIALLAIVAFTLLAIHLINLCMDRGARERPLVRRMAEMDKKLFQSTNELLLLRKEAAEAPGSPLGPGPAAVRELELAAEQARLGAEQERGRQREAEAQVAALRAELERARGEAAAAGEETRQAQEMVEEVLAEKAALEGGGALQDRKLVEVVGQLQAQLESQRGLLQKYEPKLKKKEKETKELQREVKQMRADVANANLETDKMRRSVEEAARSGSAAEGRLEELGKQEEEWRSLSDLLQAQLDGKVEELAGLEEKVSNMSDELSSTKSRMLLFKAEAEGKEEQVEVLQETVEELQARGRKAGMANGGEENGGEENGWGDVSAEAWGLEEVAECREVASLRVEARRAVEAREAVEQELEEVRAQLGEVAGKAEGAAAEADTLRQVRDEVVRDRGDVQRRLDVLTEFFNKKEAELQRQLGLQSAMFGDVSSDAESSARKLVSVTSELDSTAAQVKLLRTELDDQEKSLKAAVAAQVMHPLAINLQIGQLCRSACRRRRRHTRTGWPPGSRSGSWRSSSRRGVSSGTV